MDSPSVSELQSSLRQVKTQLDALQVAQTKTARHLQLKVLGNAFDNNYGLPPDAIQGGGGVGSLIVEIPSGTMNGTNVTFTLTQVPTGSWLLLLLNGVYQEPAVDYTITGSTITFTVPPKASDYQLYALYRH